MAQYVAFLRAINVGKRRVKMERLRECFEALDGFDEVSTHIASGNVIFSAKGRAAELERKIEKQLESELGFEVQTFLRTRKQLADLVEAKPPFEVGEKDTHLVVFLRAKPKAAAKKAVEALADESDKDELVLDGRELHWRIRGGQMDSKVKSAHMTKALAGDPGTNRNMKMLRKLVAKLDA